MPPEWMPALLCGSMVVLRGAAMHYSSELASVQEPPASFVQDVKLRAPRLAEPPARMPDGVLLEPGFPGLTNPSLTLLPELGEAWVVLRRLSYSSKCPSPLKGAYYNEVAFGRTSLEDLRGWHSSTAAPQHWKQFQILPDPRFHGQNASGQTPCARKKDIAGVASYGIEDPRLFVLDGKRYMYVVASTLLKSACDKAHCPRPACPEDVGFRIHVTELIPEGAKVRYGPTVALHMDKMFYDEKAWSMFEVESSKGRLHAVYNVHPHTILGCDLRSGRCKRLHEETSPLVLDLARRNGIDAETFHGGAGVAKVNFGDEAVMLSVMHFSYYDISNARFGANATKVVDPPRIYKSFPYMFRAFPPFSILAVASKSLPLITDNDTTYTGGIAYVSSVGVDQGDVVLGYGQADRDARVYRQPLDLFLGNFFP